MNSNKTPLYILAREKKQGNLQIIDKETLEWYKKVAKPQRKHLSEVLPEYVPTKGDNILLYIPQKSWFLRQKHINSIHGIRHILRVILYSNILAYTEKGYKVNISDTLICAAVHDLRRTSDKGDSGHGDRAARWFKSNLDKFSESDMSNLEDILYVIKNHETPPELLNSESGIYKDKLLTILRNADAVDRYRLPKEKWWAKKEYLQLSKAIKLLEFAKYFVYATELDSLINPDKSIDIILYHSNKLGILR